MMSIKNDTKLQKIAFYTKKKQKSFADSKKVPTFASAFKHQALVTQANPKDGAIVYRLGREIFILKSGVRFPVALQS